MKLVGEFLSYDPYGSASRASGAWRLMLRKDDPQWNVRSTRAANVLLYGFIATDPKRCIIARSSAMLDLSLPKKRRRTEVAVADNWQAWCRR